MDEIEKIEKKIKVLEGHIRLLKKKHIRLLEKSKPIYPTWYPNSYNHIIIIPWSKATYTYNGEFKVQK